MRILVPLLSSISANSLQRREERPLKAVIAIETRVNRIQTDRDIHP
jgi:hypothetical protein